MADPRTSDTKVVKTLPQLAEEIGVHRSTLVRLEQKGIIDKAPLVGKPVQGRVYDPELEKRVKFQVEKYLEKRNRANEGRPDAPKNFIIK